MRLGRVQPRASCTRSNLRGARAAPSVRRAPVHQSQGIRLTIPDAAQVFLVILFWALRLAKGDRRGPRLLFIRRLNRALARFTPWQTVVGTLTLLYAIRHTDCVMGLQAPEPLARLYARSVRVAVRFADTARGVASCEALRAAMARASADSPRTSS